MRNTFTVTMNLQVWAVNSRTAPQTPCSDLILFRHSLPGNTHHELKTICIGGLLNSASMWRWQASPCLAQACHVTLPKQEPINSKLIVGLGDIRQIRFTSREKAGKTSAQPILLHKQLASALLLRLLPLQLVNMRHTTSAVKVTSRWLGTHRIWEDQPREVD